MSTNIKIATTKKTRVLSGREEGKRFRAKYVLDEKDKDKNVYIVTIPDEVIALNTSFILGMFGNSIRTLDREGFKQKYVFEIKPPLLNSIENSITRALKTIPPLNID